MGDDLANNWGTNLCNLSREDKLDFKNKSTALVFDEFKRIVSNQFQHEFVLQRVTQDGSTANLLAIVDATLGDTSTCLFAAGCYVSADNSFLQNLSTSDFDLSSNLSVVQFPDSVVDPFAPKSLSRQAKDLCR